jgi:cell wall-associated NlpC family hydrolase
MANRILCSAAVTLALTLIPSLVFATPTKGVKKRAAKTVRLARKTHHHHKRARTHRTRHYSRRYHRHHSRRVVESSMISRYHRSYVAETPPLMKVIPQRDGNFLLEPLTPPKKTSTTPLSESYNTSNNDWISSQIHRYNAFAPWGFRELVLAMAKAYDHTPYCYGASLETSNATDCSGFVQFIYHQFKIDLPRSSREQARIGRIVTRRMDFSKLLPGDLLFFRRHGHIGHAGIYLGEGKMIHASNPRTGVTITNIQNDPYYRNTFVVAKRVFVVKYPE